MKKILVCFLSLLIILSLFTSCDSASMDSDPAYNGGSGYKSEVSDGMTTESTTDGGKNDASETERKIIKTYRLRMETLSYDSAVDQITAAAQSFGGYVAAATQDGQGIYTDEYSYRTRSATFTVRVPAERAESFLSYISDGQNVLSSSLNTEDVTDSYYGYQARLDSLVVQEERLMAMMEKAETLSDLLQLEDKLSEVRAEINGISSRIQLMDKSVEYSYVYITLNEVKEYKEPEKESYFSRMVASFGDAFESFATVVGEFFIAFIWVFPYLIVIGVIALVVALILTRDKRRRRKETEKDKKEQSET